MKAELAVCMFVLNQEKKLSRPHVNGNNDVCL